MNSLNELTTNTNGGTLTVVGTTTSPATSVTVNGSSATLYGDATFAAAGLPLTTTYTATAQDSYGRHSTNTVTVSIATNTTFQYDGNGNLTNDGLRNFVYDDENELIQVSVSNAWMSQFAYDGKMRRRVRQEFAWEGGAWVQTNAVYYVYDGNLVIQERDMNNLPTVTYTRGKDLSGSLQGAGGIGGLLARTSQAYQDAPLAGHSFYHCDGNGNVTMLIDSSQGIVAKYLYDAFGNMLSKSGLLADANVYRFSSKEWHANSGLAYYLYRYYDPNLQRWLNRDPIGELGGINLYVFVGSSPVYRVDLFGLSWVVSATPFAPGQEGTYGPYAEYINDGRNDIIPADQYPTQDQFYGGLNSTDLDFLPALLPEIPVVSEAFSALGDIFGSALEKLGLKTPNPTVRCPTTTGQIHHPISRPVFKALERNPSLKGQFSARDPRFETQAMDEAAHQGYQQWHRDVDNQLINWISSNPNATPQDFIDYLLWRYSQPDLMARFPNGL